MDGSWNVSNIQKSPKTIFAITDAFHQLTGYTQEGRKFKDRHAFFWGGGVIRPNFILDVKADN